MKIQVGRASSPATQLKCWCVGRTLRNTFHSSNLEDKMRSSRMKNQSQEYVFCLPETPLGPLWFSFTDRGLAALEFAGDGSVSMLSDDGLPKHLNRLSMPSGDSCPATLTASPRFRLPAPGALDGTAFPAPGVGRTPGKFPTGPPSIQRNWPGGSGASPPGRGPGQCRQTPSPSLSPVTGSSTLTGGWAATVRGWTGSAGCCAGKGQCERRVLGSGF